MKRFEDRSRRQRAAIDAVATLLRAPVKLFEAFGALWLIVGVLAGFYALGLLAWSIITRL